MSVLRLIREILREIFDESAYARFCAREDLSANRESYQKFLREPNATRSTRIKCC